MKNSYLTLITRHLNAPYGVIVRADDIARVLRAGSVHVLDDQPFARELASSIFIEMEPEIIGAACYEAGVDITHAQLLYEELRAEQGLPVVFRWQDAVRGALA
jgi:hypothetical protein